MKYLQEGSSHPLLVFWLMFEWLRRAIERVDGININPKLHRLRQIVVCFPLNLSIITFSLLHHCLVALSLQSSFDYARISAATHTPL